MTFRGPKVRLLLSSPTLTTPGCQIELEVLIQRAIDQDKSYAFQSIISHSDDQKYSLWLGPVADIDGTTYQFQDAVALCSQFIAAPAPNAGLNCITFCSGKRGTCGENAVFHLVISRTPADMDIEHFRFQNPPMLSSDLHEMASHFIAKISHRLSNVPVPSILRQHQQYHLLSSSIETPFYKNRKHLITILITLLLLLLIPIVLTLSRTTHAIYIRYNTSSTTGPKYQLRLTHQNATTFARTHLLPSPESYTLRLDDQTLIPTSLYTPEEDKYQLWFRNRYPHMVPVLENRTYLRPSWLGSLAVGESLLWDEKFHFAHCILALRRYWLARESGKHVCGRDVDFGHVEHCLGYLDGKVFTPGPMDEVWEDGNKYYLWWQTKVCFDE